MADYRVYRLTEDDTIVNGQWIVQENDREAVLAAARLINGSPAVEIWSGTRKVARLTARQLGTRSRVGYRSHALGAV
jgi:hypothetical protein